MILLVKVHTAPMKVRSARVLRLMFACVLGKFLKLYRSENFC